jgi:hypothetical protein
MTPRPVRLASLKSSRIVTSDHELRKITGEIAWYEEEARKSAGLLLQYRLEIGKRLARAKAILPHGQFLSWAQQEFGWAPRHVQNHLTLAANANRISRLDAGASLNMALAAIKKLEPCNEEGTVPLPTLVQRVYLIGEIEEGKLDCEAFLAEVARLAFSFGASKTKWKVRATSFGASKMKCKTHESPGKVREAAGVHFPVDHAFNPARASVVGV